MIIGILSDTHNLLPESIHDAFAGVDRIIHAGDIGPASIIYEPQAIAPVEAVLGNCDYPSSLPDVPPRIDTTLGGARFRIVHRPEDMDFADRSIDIFVHGHTHRRRYDEIAGRTIVNPGSASRPRGMEPAGAAIMEVERGSIVRFEFVDLSYL